MHDLAALILIAGALAGCASVPLCLLILWRLCTMPTQADVQALADRVIALGAKVDAAIAGDTPPLDLSPVDAAVSGIEAKFVTPPADSPTA